MELQYLKAGQLFAYISVLICLYCKSEAYMYE